MFPLLFLLVVFEGIFYEITEFGPTGGGLFLEDNGGTSYLLKFGRF